MYNEQKPASFFDKMTHYTKILFARAFDFKGFSAVPEFWYPAPLWFIINIGAWLPKDRISMFAHILCSVLSVVYFIPMFSCAFRRMHDIGRTGLSLVMGCIPILNLYLLFLLAKRGETDRQNKSEEESRQWYAEQNRQAEERKLQEETLKNQLNEKCKRTQKILDSFVHEPEFDYLYKLLINTPTSGRGYRPLKEDELMFFTEDGGTGTKPAPVIYVRNMERSAAIERIIIGSGIFSEAGGAPPKSNDYKDTPALDAVARLGASPLNSLLRESRRDFPTVRTPEREYNVASQKNLFTNCETVLNQRFADRVKAYKYDYRGIYIGLAGEDAVQEQLELHGGSYIVLHNIRIEETINGVTSSAEIDTLVLAPTGVFSIEIKNIGSEGDNYIFIEADGSWYRKVTHVKKQKPQFDRKGNDITPPPITETSLEPMDPNPFRQNDRHVALLERKINEALGRGMSNWIRVRNTIVFANDNIHIENRASDEMIVARVGSIYSAIVKDRGVRYTEEELYQMKDIIERATLPAKGYPMYDYSEELRTIILTYRQIQQFKESFFTRLDEEYGKAFQELYLRVAAIAGETEDAAPHN